MASSTGLALSALPDAARALVEAESNHGNHGTGSGNINTNTNSSNTNSSNTSSTIDDSLLSVDALVEREMAACWLPALTARDTNAVETRNANVARLIDRLAAALMRMTSGSGLNGGGGANGALSTAAVSSALPLSSSSSSSSSSSFGSDAGSADDDSASSAAAFEPALCAADAAQLRSAFWELIGDDGVQRHRLARARQLLRRQHAQVAYIY